MRKHFQGIDHTVIAVRDLDAAGDTFARMGFTLTPRGFHTLGSQNHCVMLGQDYVELMWLPPGLKMKVRPFIADFLERGEGLAALALKTNNAAAAHAELARAGLDPTRPMRFSPGRSARRQARCGIRTLDIGRKYAPAGRMFVCQHLTPDLVWRPEHQRHGNGASALAAVAIVARDVAPVARMYSRIFDREPKEIAEGLLVETGGAPLAIVTERSLGVRLPGVWITSRPLPMIAALFIHVADRATAEAALRAGGLHPMRMPDGSIAVGAAEAHGVALVFG